MARNVSAGFRGTVIDRLTVAGTAATRRQRYGCAQRTRGSPSVIAWTIQLWRSLLGLLSLPPRLSSPRGSQSASRSPSVLPPRPPDLRSAVMEPLFEH
jgi:hypothetical protein